MPRSLKFARWGLLGASLLAAPLLARFAPPTPTPHVMTAEELRAFAHHFNGVFAEAVHTGNTLAFAEKFCAPDFTLHMAGDPKIYHRTEYIDLLNVFHTAFPDMQADIKEVIVEGDKIATFAAFHYTHTGYFGPLAPTGNKLEYQQMSIMQVSHDQIQEAWLVYDKLAVWTQLGFELVAVKK